MLGSVHSICMVSGFVLLAFAALHDVCFRTVPNYVPVTVLLAGMILRLEEGNPTIGLLCGTAVLCCTYTFWRFRWIGGADAKLLSACAVFVPPSLLPAMIIGTSLSGGVLAVIYLTGSYFAPSGRRPTPQANIIVRAAYCELRRLRRRGPLPYAAAIATGSWLAVAGS